VLTDDGELREAQIDAPLSIFVIPVLTAWLGSLTDSLTVTGGLFLIG
jgi:hypothetical protein